MSWLQLAIIGAPPQKSSDDMFYHGAEVFVNTSVIRCLKKRQDGNIQLDIDGINILANILMEYQTLPYTYISQNH